MFSDALVGEGQFQPLFSLNKTVQRLPERNQANFWNSLTMSILLMTVRISSVICVRNGALLFSKSATFLQTGPGWWLKWCHGLIQASPSTSFPNSSDPEQRCHSLPIPLPDSPLRVATRGWTHAMGLGWKGERKGRGVFSFSVCTPEWVDDVKLHHHTEACEMQHSRPWLFGAELG